MSQNEMNLTGCVPLQGLQEEQLEHIWQLARVCGDVDGFSPEANLSVAALRNREPDRVQDFLSIQGGKVVGYLGMFSFAHEEEVEITGFVHPAWRRRGIFKGMLEQALAECARRQVTRILLVVNRQAKDAQAAAERLGAHYDFSEYRLDFDAASFHRLVPVSKELELRPAAREEEQLLVEIGMSGFSDSEAEMASLIRRNLANPLRQLYLATYRGEPVGMITASREEETVFLTAFCVRQEEQGKGIGRQILTRMVSDLRAAGESRIALEVEATNENALHLYQSCGFVVSDGYHYYQLP